MRWRESDKWGKIRRDQNVICSLGPCGNLPSSATREFRLVTHLTFGVLGHTSSINILILRFSKAVKWI